MGWQDRDYNDTPRGNPGGTLMSILMGSVPLGRWWGIRVRVHASLIIYILFKLFAAGRGHPYAFQLELAGIISLFTIVLLHEFGHCIGARLVGGRAEDILLWPLGGLASVETARRPWPSFVATACGPLVNLIICGVLLLILEIVYGFKMPLPLNPMLPFASTDYAMNDLSFRHILANSAGDGIPWQLFVWLGYNTSWMLFVFNVFLPIFPMDGGRLLQEILWPWLGFVRSMKFACYTGMVGGVLLGLFGLISVNFLLIFIAISGVSTCYQTLLMVRHGYLEEDAGPDLSAATWNDSPKPRKIKHSKGWFSAARRRAKKEQAEQAEIDAILAKVHEKGLHSLSWREKRALKRATEKQRQRDLAEERL